MWLMTEITLFFSKKNLPRLRVHISYFSYLVNLVMPIFQYEEYWREQKFHPLVLCAQTIQLVQLALTKPQIDI